ncbi:MAG: PHP domain-containing protein [Ruminococcaceae bacterium]|nr:PHP domain-containing protein [Oscillospiraceae bacterium]
MTVSGTCDLHIHSNHSDGTCTPSELLNLARKAGLTAAALCDHNTVSGLPAFLDAAQAMRESGEPCPAAVPGVEFSTVWREYELHILALFVPEEHFSDVEALLELPKLRKEQSNRDLVARLSAAGYALDYDELRAATPDGYVNRAHVAAALVERGHVASRTEAFDRLLGNDCGFYVPPQRLDAFEVIRFIRSVGAAAVLAHPLLTLDAETLESFLPDAVEAGLDGMEVYYSTYDAATQAQAREIAARYGLLESGGSDFHGGNKPDIAIGCGYGALSVPAEVYEGLRRRVETRNKCN